MKKYAKVPLRWKSLTVVKLGEAKEGDPTSPFDCKNYRWKVTNGKDGLQIFVDKDLLIDWGIGMAYLRGMPFLKPLKNAISGVQIHSRVRTLYVVFF